MSPTRPKYAFFLSLTVLLLAPWLCSRPSVPRKASAEDTVRVGAINLGYQNTQPDPAGRALAHALADVILLQEWTGRNISPTRLTEADLRVVLSDGRDGTHGSALLARPNLVQAASTAQPPWTGNCVTPLLTVRLDIEGRKIGIVGVHGPPPVLNCRRSRKPYLRAIARLVENGRLRESVGVIPAGTPVLLVGDLNALGWEEPLRSMDDRGLTDAFDAGSWRLGPTWSPGWWSPSLVAIDYLWMPQEACARKAWTLSVLGSDHRAVVADISFP